MDLPELLHPQYRLAPGSASYRTRSAPPFEPADKLAKTTRRNGTRVAYDRSYGPWLSRVQGSLLCCCSILRERSELSRSVHDGHTPAIRARKARERAFRLLFRGFNFRGLPVNRENGIPRKFPAIRHSEVATCNTFRLLIYISVYLISKQFLIVHVGQTGITVEAAAARAGIGLDTLSNECSQTCLLYTSPSPRDATLSRMPSSA